MEHAATDYKALYEESLLALAKKEEELRLTLAEREEVIADLQFELDKFRKYFFGKKSEKLPASQLGAGQIGLFELGTSQEQQEQLSEELPVPAAEKPKPKQRDPATGRTTLPAELRREVIVIEPQEDVTGCTLIGEEVTEVLELIPAEFYVKRYVRPQYARPNGEGIIMGLLPGRVIDKGIPSESVLAQMSVDKIRLRPSAAPPAGQVYPHGHAHTRLHSLRLADESLETPGAALGADALAGG